MLAFAAIVTLAALALVAATWWGLAKAAWSWATTGVA